MPEGSIEVRRTLKAPRARVFDAWCQADVLARWFFPEPGWRADVRAEPRPGGRYRIALTDPGGGLHVQEGTYETIDRPARLVLSWTCEELGVRDSRLVVEFEDLGDRTEVVIRHELPPDPKVLQGHEHGWRGCLAHLAQLLEARTGEP